MKFHQEDGSFSADLQPLTHAGHHLVKIAHGNMSGCLWSGTFIASCKVGHTTNEMRECILAEDEQVCCSWTNIYKLCLSVHLSMRVHILASHDICGMQTNSHILKAVFMGIAFFGALGLLVFLVRCNLNASITSKC